MGVINNVKEFIVDRGFTVMIFGISTATVGVLLYAFLNTPRYAAFYYPQAAMGLAVLGIASYIVGRVSVQMQRNGNRRKAMEMLSRRDRGDESFEPPPRGDGESGAK